MREDESSFISVPESRFSSSEISRPNSERSASYNTRTYRRPYTQCLQLNNLAGRRQTAGNVMLTSYGYHSNIAEVE